jgi:hypothetical protein
LPALFIRREGAAQDRHLFRHHERRVKTHAELTDQTHIRLLLLRELFQKRLGAGMRDGAEVLDEFAVRHAEAGVGDGDGARLVVGGDADARRDFRLIHRFAGRLIEPEFLARVRRVGDQLAHEDFFVRVKRMDDDVQQLLNLRLKMMGLGFAHKGLFS